MSNIGVLIETEDGEVKDANFGVVTAGRGEGENTIYAFVLDAAAEDCKDALQTYGVQKVVAVSADSQDLASSPERQSMALAEVVKQFDISALLGLNSVQGRDLLARLAALIAAPLVQDCIHIDVSAQTAIKSHFSGKTNATLKLNGNPCLYSIRPNTIEAREASCEAEVLSCQVAVQDSSRLVVKEVKQSDTGKVDITEANIIITGGRPIGSPENYQILQDCADVLGAAVGASRAAVDAGFAPHGMQVGQTGKTVSPKLYIGCGLSGSVQHFAGMKTAKVIVAINTDKDAPIFNKCDYGLVGDLFEVVPELTEVLKAQKSGE